MTTTILWLILWALVAVQDVVRREIYTGVLLAMALLGLVGHEWYWWVAVGLALFWPPDYRRLSVGLALASLALGTATGDMAVSLALGVGVLAWGLGWWSEADPVVLLALALRHGLAGVVAGAVALLLAAVVLMTRRRQWRQFRAVLFSAATGNVDADEIPAGSEMPAAAVMATAGAAIELWRGGMSMAVSTATTIVLTAVAGLALVGYLVYELRKERIR